MPKLPSFLGRLLCWLGVHDVRVIESHSDLVTTMGLKKSSAGDVE